MISEDFYKDALDKYLSSTKDEWNSRLRIVSKNIVIPQDIQQMYDTWVNTNEPPSAELVLKVTDLYKQITNSTNEVINLVVPTVAFDARKMLDDYYKQLEDAETSKAEGFKRNAEAERISRETEHKAHVAEVEAYNESLLAPLKEKQQELLSYKEDFERVFSKYEISPLDVPLPDDMDISSYSSIVDSAIAACKNFSDKKLTVLDPVLNSLDNETNLTFTMTILIILILILYAILPIAAIPAFCVSFLGIHKVYSNMNELRLASALMSEVNFERFVPEDSFKTADELITEDIDRDLQDKLSSDIKSYSDEKEQSVKELEGHLGEIDNQLNDLKRDIGNSHNVAKANADKVKKEVEAMKQIVTSRVVAFPDICSDHLYMSHDFILAKKAEGVDIPTHYDNLNLIFDTSNRDAALNNLKLHLCNILLNVQVKQITVEIFDPRSLCSEFTEFMTVDTKDYIKPNSCELKKLLDQYKKVAQSNVIDLNGLPMDEYNMDAEKRELVPKSYTLVILVSAFENLFEEKKADEFYDFLAICNSQGVMFWIMDSIQHKNCTFVPNNYSGNGTPITYDRTLGSHAVSTFVTTLSRFKDKGISYKEKMGEKFIPYEKWWTFDTIHGIKMPYGLEKGDPTRGLNVAPEIGDANVHALLGGATGAGKSACINQLLISLITMYPPSELELVYIDFKNVEAAKFTGGYDTAAGTWMEIDEVEKCLRNGIYYDRVSRIPHLRIISGTTDGGYALSVFEFLMEEMKRRQGIINKFGRDQTKIEGVRKCILEDYIKNVRGGEKCSWADMRRDWDWYKANVYDVWGDLPRLLVIFDEFQVMYNPEYVDSRTIDTINSKITAITKLARAMGAHFWFTSQSMKGTMSKDTMANFSLRGALRCTTEVSNELIGNDEAGHIKQKFGYMYTNDSAGQDKTANKLWRVPFLSEDDMSPVYIDRLFPLLDKFNEKHRMARFYDEKVLVPSKIMDEWYDLHPDVFGDQRAFILGERAEYSSNAAPITMTLQDDTGENIVIAASDRSDLLNLTLTVIKNIRKKNGTTMILNMKDKESNIIIGGEDFVDPQFAQWVSPDTDVMTILDTVQQLIDMRKAKEGPYDPIYVAGVNWERVTEFSNFKTENKVATIFKEGPIVGVHFILCVKEWGDLTKGIVAQCRHRVLGLLTTDAIRFTDNMKVEKLPSADKGNGLFAFYEFGNILNKFRIYQHHFKQEVKSREIVLRS